MLVLDKDTATPPDVAGPFRYTVPVHGVPPGNVLGERARETSESGLISRDADFVLVPCVAVIVTDWEAVTDNVGIANVPVVLPAVTVTAVGGLAKALFEDNSITVPFAGAGPFRVTRPVALFPPTTELGETVSPVKTSDVIVRVALAEPDPTCAVIVALVGLGIADVAMVKVALTCKAGTMTVFGGAAAELFDARLTTIPPAGAVPFKVTVPVEEVPPTTDAGDNERLVGTGEVINKVADTETPSAVAVITEEFPVDTGVVEILKDEVEAPPGIVTDDGVFA